MTGATATFGGQHVDYNITDPSFPQSFFQASRSRQAVPSRGKSLSAEDHTVHLNIVQEILPVNIGDLLLLVDQFLRSITIKVAKSIWQAYLSIRNPCIEHCQGSALSICTRHTRTSKSSRPLLISQRLRRQADSLPPMR